MTIKPMAAAHQQGRKADMMLKSGKPEEAIFCHRRAAEYLLQAMQLSTCMKAKDSISLQHQFHLRQQDLLQERLGKLQSLQAKKSNRKDLTQSQGTQTDLLNLDGSLNSVDAASQALSDTDSVLEYLINREKQERGPLSPQQLPEKHKIVQKVPRDDKSIIEELTIQNAELRKHVHILIKDLDECKGDNEFLLQRVLTADRPDRGSDNKDLFGRVIEDEKSPNFELPPLEQPHFDFDSIGIPVEALDNSVEEKSIFFSD
ncbi:nuclear receptor-binding factor 2-like [Ylistrum balloti]|uniref:nuclear receptor-binding factor 2-like n=1 Tax=Ylistrum balloti TaxID=509963 RepID=UPI002905AA02|nr:nuclear receptor-binding factor 2-like [Ylistrum balloti]